MDSLHSPSGSAHRSRRRRKRSPIKEKILATWGKWWVEFLIVCLLLLAVFLLVEEMNIRETLLAGLRGLGQGLNSLAGKMGAAWTGLVARTRLSDVIAIVLLIVVSLLLAWRTRTRLLASPTLNAICCPRCDGDLHRVHRRWHERLLGLYVPLRRYRCASRECGWSGLRFRNQ